jgi:hypothetical protein
MYEAGLSLDDLRKPNCTYCGTVFPHHAQAAQHAQMASQVMGQMMQQQAVIQDQWRGAFGVPPLGGGPPGGPPPMGVLMPPPPGAPGSPYADPMRIAQAHAVQANQLSRMITWLVVGSMAAVLAVVILIVVLGVVLR